MPDLVRATYLTHDPDFGNLVLGFFQDTPLYCAILASALTTPLSTSQILIHNPPADLNGSDYLQTTITATAGNSVTGAVEETFTYIQTKGISFAGIVTALANVTIDLDQTDATYGGSARIDTITVELLKYKISDATTTQIAALTRTINKGVTGIVSTAPYAEPSLSELFTFDVGISPTIDIGATAGYLLQMKITVGFSALAHASATVSTIAKCRINCYRDLSKTTYLSIPVV